MQECPKLHEIDKILSQLKRQSTTPEVKVYDIDLRRITYADELADQLPDIEEQFDYVIVDNAGNLGEATRSTLLTAKIAVIPISPSGLDLMSAALAVKVVRQNQKARGGYPKAGIFINKGVRNTKLLKEAVGAIGRFEGVSPLGQIIYQRQAIADSFLQNATVWDAAGNKDAAANYQKLFGEILRLGVATCNYKCSNLQSSYFQTRIKCNYNCASARINCN